MSDACCTYPVCTKKTLRYSNFCRDHQRVLDARKARCGCGRTEPSSEALAFFKYRGPGSDYAARMCGCGYYDTAHVGEPHARRNVVEEGLCKGFAPVGDLGTDEYYCGCRGWD